MGNSTSKTSKKCPKGNKYVHSEDYNVEVSRIGAVPTISKCEAPSIVNSIPEPVPEPSKAEILRKYSHCQTLKDIPEKHYSEELYVMILRNYSESPCKNNTTYSKDINNILAKMGYDKFINLLIKNKLEDCAIYLMNSNLLRESINANVINKTLHELSVACQYECHKVIALILSKITYLPEYIVEILLDGKQVSKYLDVLLKIKGSESVIYSVACRRNDLPLSVKMLGMDNGTRISPEDLLYYPCLHKSDSIIEYVRGTFDLDHKHIANNGCRVLIECINNDMVNYLPIFLVQCWDRDNTVYKKFTHPASLATHCYKGAKSEALKTILDLYKLHRCFLDELLYMTEINSKDEKAIATVKTIIPDRLIKKRFI